MTPELPRAPISAAREISFASAGPVVRPLRVDHLRDRAHRQCQVRAGVAVGHRVDVEVVDPRAVRLDRGARALDELADALPHALARTRWMTTSTAATSSPVSRVTS